MPKMFRIALSALVLAVLFAAPGLAYDNVTPAEAYALATTDANVYILDVRTAAEWEWVGHPGINKSGLGAALEGKIVNISYEISHKGSLILNPCFLREVEEIFEGNPNVILITMCRSGSRSVKAAIELEAEGFRVLNMVTGFEGDKDADGYRTVNGWKVNGLPYNYNGTGYYR